MGSIGESTPLTYPLPQQQASPRPVTLNGDAPPIDEISTPILIVGGGPVGMLLAYALSHHHGQPCVLVEQSKTTTQYPKMEFTNGRSMEIYRQMGLSSQVRGLGVPERYSLNEIITTSLADGSRPVAVWERDSPEIIREKSREQNDGSWAREPYFRGTQIVLEKWLKGLVEGEKGIRSFWGWKFVGLRKEKDEVESEIVEESGRRLRIRSHFVVGCDGGGSLVRKVIGGKAERKNLDVNMVFVHMKSRDPRITAQGQFWHLMTLSGAALVAQDEKDTWTWHLMVPEDTDLVNFDAEKAVHTAAGGVFGPCQLEVDEFLIKGVWKSKVAVAESFESQGRRVLLAGDAAHQLSPIGGHGLNSGIGDIWDLSWKLAAVIKGWGGPELLRAYDLERRPVSQNNLKMVEKGTVEVLLPMLTAAQAIGVKTLLGESPEGVQARAELEKQIQKGHWLHHQDGVTLGYRYSGSPIVVHENQGVEPEKTIERYTPSTWPGGRPPHVFMRDGETSVFDLLGAEFNVVDFTRKGQLGERFVAAAAAMGIPMKKIHLPDEQHVREVWERDVVLLRPDGHVCWRLPKNTERLGEGEVEAVLQIVSGNRQ